MGKISWLLFLPNISQHLAASIRKNTGAAAGFRPAKDGEDCMDELLYTINQCCRLASIGRTKFYELVANGEIPIRKVGKKSLVAAADLKRWADRLPAIEVELGEQQSDGRGGSCR